MHVLYVSVVSAFEWERAMNEWKIEGKTKKMRNKIEKKTTLLKFNN